MKRSSNAALHHYYKSSRVFFKEKGNCIEKPFNSNDPAGRKERSWYRRTGPYCWNSCFCSPQSCSCVKVSGESGKLIWHHTHPKEKENPLMGERREGVGSVTAWLKLQWMSTQGTESNSSTSLFVLISSSSYVMTHLTNTNISPSSSLSVLLQNCCFSSALSTVTNVVLDYECNFHTIRYMTFQNQLDIA